MVKPLKTRRRSIRAANDNHRLVALEAPGLATITIAELDLLETYFGDIISDIITRQPANDDEEMKDK